VTSDDRPDFSTPAPPEVLPAGRVYRAQGRPGLTTPGVAIIGTAVSLVAALLSVLVTDNLNWIFTVPFVLVSGYCAWEVRPDRMRSALIMPPLVMLLVVVVTPWVSGEAGGIRSGVLRSLTVLTKMAPPLTAAVAVTVAILAWRRWGPGKR